MIFDDTLIFSKAQAVTVTAPSTNVIDTGAVGTPYGSTVPLVHDIGIGAEIPLVAQVVTAFAGGTSLQVVYQTAADAAFTTPVNIALSPAVLTAELKPGYQFVLDRVPANSRQRYQRLNYVAVGTFTAGAVTAGIVTAVQRNPL